VTKEVQWPNGIALSLEPGNRSTFAGSDGKNPRVAVCGLDGSALLAERASSPLL
jgi:hypothetical protein